MRSSKHVALFDISFSTLLDCLRVHIDPLFMGVSHRVAFGLTIIVVNNLFNVVVENSFSDFNLIYTDGSESKESAGFSIYIPQFYF